MLITNRTQRGVTLIELMIGMLVGLIIVGGGVSVYVASIKANSDNLKLMRLNQDLRSMMDLMVKDIRRAGFVTDDPANNFASLQNNPFFDDSTSGATTDIALPNGNPGNCIVYSYNADIDTPPTVSNDEYFGFRLVNNALEMRKTGTTNENCTAANEWDSITEPEVAISELTFTLVTSTLNVTSMATDSDGDGCLDGDDQAPNTASSSCKTGDYGNGLCDSGESCNTCTLNGSPDPACLYVRNVTLRLTGRLVDDPSVTQTLIEQVRVRNDKFVAALP